MNVNSIGSQQVATQYTKNNNAKTEVETENSTFLVEDTAENIK